MTGTVVSGRRAWVRAGGLAGLLVSFASACVLETGGMANVVGDVDVVDDGGGEIRWDDGDGWGDDVRVEGDAGVCGDGLLDPGEACDDGNASDNDACVAGCVAATCGDGFWWSGMEECDDGAANSNATPDACRTDCTPARCGDAVIDTGEACDDGNTIDTDACRNTCARAGCGDGVVGPGEECDDGNGVNTDACPNSCVAATCGDGFVWAASEDCDRAPPRACTTSCASTGSEACVACRWAGACVPPVEVCNGLDDDCDTACDNGFACCADALTTCTVGSCTGAASCSAGCVVGECNLGAAPVNDTCAGATSIALPGGTFTGSTCPAASDYNPGGGCGVTDAKDVVYHIALSQRSRVVASTVGSAFDTVLYVRSTDCAGGAQVACDNDGGGGGASRIDTTLDAGVYYLFLDGDGPAQAGAFSLNVQIIPGNDTCAGAIDVGAGGVFTGTTLGAANDYSGGCGDVGGADVVYALTLTGGSDVFITTVGSAFDTVLYLVRDSCAGSMIACTDDYRAPLSTGSILIRDNQGAGVYYIVADGKTAAARGDYRLEVSVTPNDDEGDRCGQPFEFGPGAFPMQECDATNGSGNEYSGSCGGDNRDEIYYVVIPVAGSRTFTTCHPTTNFNTVLYLRSACADSGSQIGCNNDDGVCPSASNRSTFTASLTPGIYYLFVDGQGAQGDYCVEIR